MILEGMRTLFILNLRHAIRDLGLKHLEVHNRSVPNLKLHEAYHIFLDSKSLGGPSQTRIPSGQVFPGKMSSIVAC
jgi:hypothetical protein